MSQKKCVSCKYFDADGDYKGRKTYYCNHVNRFKFTSNDFVCYGHPVKPIITRAPKWCPVGKVG